MHHITSSIAHAIHYFVEKSPQTAFMEFSPQQHPHLTPVAMQSFDDIFQNLAHPPIVNLTKFLNNRSHVDPQLKRKLLPYFTDIDNKPKSAAARTVRQYLTILFQILDQFPLRGYSNKQNAILQEVYENFRDGCEFNQISGFRTIIIKTVGQEPDVIKCLRINSLLQLHFAVALQEYRKQLIADEIQKAAPAYLEEVRSSKGDFELQYNGLQLLLFNGDLKKIVAKNLPGTKLPKTTDLDEVILMIGNLYSDDSDEDLWQLGFDYLVTLAGPEAIAAELEVLGADIRKESVEMEFVVMKLLRFTKDTAKAHFYEDSPIAQAIAISVHSCYDPIQFFLEGLSDRTISPLLTKLHTEISSWYSQGDLDPYEEKNKRLLLEPGSDGEELWFTKKAISYCLEQNGILN